MQWFYLTVVLLFAAATMIFALENVQAVTMSFLGLSIRAPLALLAAVAYVHYLVAAYSHWCVNRSKVPARAGRDRSNRQDHQSQLEQSGMLQVCDWRQLKVNSPTVEPWICGDVLGPSSLAPSG